MEKGLLPKDFVEQMGLIFGNEELSLFLEAITSKPSPTGVRLNPIKSKHLQIETERIPWTQRGFILENRPNFTLDPSFHSGAYYVQEPSSMLVEWIANQLLEKSISPFILDLAAAPGGKSTILAEIAHDNNGVLIANEVIKSRVPILKQNLAKWGFPNTFVSSFEVSTFKSIPPIFDLILLDAPCSGEGLFRKDIQARDEWSLENVNHCSLRQKRILQTVPGLLKPGGYLIYSTCTYNLKENDEQVSWLCQNFPLQVCELEIPEKWGIRKTEQGGFQCFPHLVQGEGFYLAVLQNINSNKNTSTSLSINRNAIRRKKLPLPDAIHKFLNPEHNLIGIQDNAGNYYGIQEENLEHFDFLSSFLPFIDPVLQLGESKGNDFIPSPELALSKYIKDEIPRWELERFEALTFLKKEISTLKPPHLGWGLVTYGNLNLGWYKSMGDRYNNYFPKNWRILMSLPLKSALPNVPFSFKTK